MNEERITASYSRKVNTGNYENYEVGMSSEAQLEEGDDPEDCQKELQKKVQRRVEDRITRREAARKMEDSRGE